LRRRLENKEELNEDQIKISKKLSQKPKRQLYHKVELKYAVTEVDAVDWLAQVLFAPEKADKLKTFLIDHDQVLGLVNQKLLR
jgi:ribonuclease HII